MSLHDSADTMWSGRLTLWQPARREGYRFNLDSILLTGFAAERAGPLGHVLDLGAGCGIIGLMLLAAGRAQRVTSVERQPALAAFVRRNIEANALGAQATVIEGDLRELPLPQADVVTFNPPYFKMGAGHASVNPGRDAGRREVHGTLDDFLLAASGCITPAGCISAILPVDRVRQFRAMAQDLGLHMQRERAVHAFAEGPARHRMVQAGWQPMTPEEAEQAIGPEAKKRRCIVHKSVGGGYTDEVAALIDGFLPTGAAA